MSNPETPNAKTHSPDNPRSWGQAADVSREDPDRIESMNGASGGGQSGGGAYPNPHTGKEGKGENKEGYMGHGGQSEMPYHGTGRLGDQKVGGNENSPASNEEAREGGRQPSGD
jgi:hypothetical protein